MVGRLCFRRDCERLRRGEAAREFRHHANRGPPEAQRQSNHRFTRVCLNNAATKYPKAICFPNNFVKYQSDLDDSLIISD